MQHALCQVLKHGDEPSDCESSCPCYYSQIEGLGLHVVNITRYVIRIKKHLHNRIEIIEIERQQSKSNRSARNMNRYTHTFVTGRMHAMTRRRQMFGKASSSQTPGAKIRLFGSFLSVNCQSVLSVFHLLST